MPHNMKHDPEQLNQLRAQHLFRSAFSANLTVFAGTALLSSYYYHDTGNMLLPWLLLMTAMVAIRIFMAQAFFSDQAKHFIHIGIKQWIDAYSLATMATGTAWASLIFFIPENTSALGVSAAYIALFAVMAASISTLPVVLNAYYGYIIPMFLASFAFPFLAAIPGKYYFGIASVLYFAFITATGRMINRRYMESFNLMLQNEALIDKLHDEIIQKELAQNKLINNQAQLEQTVDLRTRELSSINEALVNEINERRRIESNLKHIAHHDSLTNLPNRLLLDARLTHALERAKRNDRQVAVLFIDLDHFKTINDSLGHDIGDKLLVSISNRLRHCIREDDTVARLGGDEFIMIIEQVHDITDLDPLLNKIMKVTEQTITIGNHELSTSASIGVSVYPDDGRTPEQLMRNADAAMYHAKENGRHNYQFYTRELTSNAYDRVALETDLKQAIARKQLLVYYQPQICLQTGKMVGVEALVRWNHHQLGILLPGQFLNIAEQCGLINQISEMVLTQACEQIVRWKQKGLPIESVAVNIAGSQIHNSDLASIVSKILSKTHCRTDWLELEITEDFLIKKKKQSVEELQKLRELGISLAIDDFGTGYSSLSYLKQLPVNKLKIDQSFVRDINSNMEDAALVQAIIAMGKSLNLKLIAEGVEQKAHEAFLSEHGCEYAQGYFYSRPVPPAEIEARLPDSASKQHKGKLVRFPGGQ